jgi:hypothetical protein
VWLKNIKLYFVAISRIDNVFTLIPFDKPNGASKGHKLCIVHNYVDVKYLLMKFIRVSKKLEKGV